MAAQKNSKAPKKQGPDWRWIFTIFFITVLISAVMSLISTNLLSSATLGVSFVILICIIAIGIVFDIIGVAVTAADEKPFHSMASRKVPEATQALKLIRNAGRVSSFCNDVIGDICGVISGSAAATIAARVLAMHPGHARDRSDACHVGAGGGADRRRKGMRQILCHRFQYKRRPHGGDGSAFFPYHSRKTPSETQAVKRALWL